LDVKKPVPFGGVIDTLIEQSRQSDQLKFVKKQAANAGCNNTDFVIASATIGSSARWSIGDKLARCTKVSSRRCSASTAIKTAQKDRVLSRRFSGSAKQ
jgi:hypothetical protein